jgi:small subunit ribosomal protein S7
MSKNLDLKLFGKWDFREVEVRDPGLRRYISLNPILIPHSGGQHEHKRFAKAKVNIVERLVNDMMRHGRCGGKKIKAINIVRNAFEIVHLKTGRNPIETLVRAIENSAPCEDVTKVSYGGIVYYISVDVAPQRRIDLALRFLTEGARKVSFSNPKSIDECLADELILAARRDAKSYAIQRRNEIERVALASR